ncbi:MAG: MarR family winged helix-turn-helix transcriptional regulator [Pararhodobacter sp.]
MAAASSTLHTAEQVVHLARLVHAGATDQCLTPAQWTALRYFARANRFSRTPSAFSEFHATTRGTASQTVKSLIAMGLLERRTNEADGRSRLLEVTATGHEKLKADPLAALSQAITELPATEQHLFAALIVRLTSTMARLRTAPIFGNCNECSHCDTSGRGPAYCRCTQTLLAEAEMDALCVDFSPAAPRLR